MAQITITIPDNLAQQLEQIQTQLPQVLELGLQALQSQQRQSKFLDEQEIIALLASQPTPEQILAISPSAGFQARVSALLAQGKEGTLSSREEAELERYLTLDHLVRIAKAHALKQLQPQK